MIKLRLVKESAELDKPEVIKSHGEYELVKHNNKYEVFHVPSDSIIDFLVVRNGDVVFSAKTSSIDELFGPYLDSDNLKNLAGWSTELAEVCKNLSIDRTDESVSRQVLESVKPTDKKDLARRGFDAESDEVAYDQVVLKDGTTVDVIVDGLNVVFSLISKDGESEVEVSADVPSSRRGHYFACKLANNTIKDLKTKDSFDEADVLLFSRGFASNH